MLVLAAERLGTGAADLRSATMPNQDCLNLRLSDWLHCRRDTAPDIQDDVLEEVAVPPPPADEVERS